MMELLNLVAPELLQQWQRTYDFKFNEWKVSTDVVRKALTNAGLKPRIPTNLDYEQSGKHEKDGFLEAAYRASSVCDKPGAVLRHGREAIHKELEKSVALVKHVRGRINNLDDWKSTATTAQRKEVQQAEEQMRFAMAKYDRMADDSDRGFFATAGIGCGFGVIALIAHVVLTVIGSGGFLQGPVLYVVLGLSVLPIVIGVMMQLAKTAQRASVEAQLYAIVKEARKQYQAACDTAERQAKDQFKALIEEIKQAEEKHAKLTDAYRMLGHEPPESLSMPSGDDKKAA